MSDIVQNLINNTLGDGARATKFACVINLPSQITGQDPLALDILCKVAQIPGKQIELIEFKYRGKTIPLMGQEKFNQTLDITFYLEENHKSRIMFEKWLSGLTDDNYSDNISSESKAIAKTTGYIDNLTLHQLDFEGNKIMATYIFKNVFPKEIASITVDSSQVDTILEYNVSFSYSHYEIKDLKNKIKTSQNTKNNTPQNQDASKDIIPNSQIIQNVEGNAGINLDEFNRLSI